MTPLASGPVIPNFGQGSSCVRGDHTFCWDMTASSLPSGASAMALTCVPAGSPGTGSRVSVTG